MNKTVKTLFRGCVDVRDYEVERCVRDGQDMHITYEGETMTLNPSSLQEKIVSISKTFVSKIGKEDYRLFSYKWEPNKYEDD